MSQTSQEAAAGHNARNMLAVLLGKRSNHVAQRAEAPVDVLGFLQTVTGRGCLGDTLRPSQVNEVQFATAHAAGHVVRCLDLSHASQKLATAVHGNGVRDTPTLT